MNKNDVIEYINAVDKNIKRFSLSNKGLTEIPKEICKLQNLESLDLSFNNIEHLPNEIWEIKKLKTLLLFRNEITEISPLIGQLQELQMLDISYNQLSELPNEISKLSKLETLDAGFNKIRVIPIDFIKLLNLKKLYLENNPLEFPTEKVVKRGLYSTMVFLTEENKRREAAKVVMQVYNMPEEIQSAFRQYIGCFNDLVSAANKAEFKFDLNFISQSLHADIELEAGVQNYLNNFLALIKQKVKVVSDKNVSPNDLNIFDLQLMELNNEMKDFTEVMKKNIEVGRSLEKKIEEIKKQLQK